MAITASPRQQQSIAGDRRPAGGDAHVPARRLCLGSGGTGRVTRTDVEVVVVGAGPAGLAAAVALANADPSIARNMAVVDPSGGWLTDWHDRMARQAISHLRSPITHHPHPEPMSLQRHCTREGLPHVMRDGRRLPSTAGFAHFVDAVIDEHNLPDVVSEAAVDVAVERERVAVRLASGAVIGCRRLVIATGVGRPRVPPGVPDDPRIRHAEAIDLRDLPSPGTRLLVVGGGLSAAHLVLGAATSGLSVTLALRGKFRVRPFDTDPGWMGPKYLRGFAAEPDRVRRRSAIAEARGGGSMPPWARQAIADLEREGALEVLRNSPLVGVDADRQGVRVQLGEVEREVDAVWLATGFEQDVSASPLLVRLAARHPIPVHDGIPDLDDDLAWRGTPVHVVGAPAALVLGPTAGNLHGQRRGAHRVATAIVPGFAPADDVVRHMR